MVTRGTIGWEERAPEGGAPEGGGESYEVVVENVNIEEMERLGKKLRAKIKDYKGNRYLKLSSGNVNIVFTSERGVTHGDKDR
jgi:hypothetical protein